ncbi:MAG TPA: sulfurtransferase complex subunit TusB [Cellvibrionaceae bacterium]
MSTLHTVNKSPSSHNTLLSCLAVCAHDDVILLIEDGVYAAASYLPTSALLTEKISSGTRIYALLSDIQARGLEQQLADNIEIIDYSGFVQLSVTHKTVQSWY